MQGRVLPATVVTGPMRCHAQGMGATYGARRRHILVLLTLLTAFAGLVLVAPQSRAAVQQPKARSVHPAATQAYTPFRLRGKWVIADVVNMALAAESYYSIHNKYPLNPAQLMASYKTFAASLQPGTQLIFETDGVNGYCITGFGVGAYSPPNGKVYDSNKGGLMTDSVRSCSQAYPTSFAVPQS
jgi:hypothetical protein